MKFLGSSLLVMLFFSSCLLPSEPDSKVQLDRSWGLAGAMNLEDAEKLAATVEDVLGHYRNLGGFEDNNLRIHVSKELGERVGWDGMLILVARADREGREAVQAKWILGAAGLEPPTQEKLRAAVLEALEIDDTNGEGQLRIILTG